MNPLLRRVLLSVIGVGIAFSALGLWQLFQTYSQLQQSQRARGTIKANHSLADGRAGSEQRARRTEVSFETARGERVHFTAANVDASAHPVGSSVEVVYEPDAPEHARVLAWKALWLQPTLLSVGGALAALSAGLVLLARGRAPR